MNLRTPDYEPQLQEAVRQFWAAREQQSTAQRDRGVSDAGTRGSVTGGKHLDGLMDVVRRVFEDTGLELDIGISGIETTLPGYYRSSKNWDMVVSYRGAVVAIIELKSQVGSFGNNLNNRVEELVGQSLDLWRAAREELLGRIRPWFGYLMLLEDSDGSRRPVRTRTRPDFPPDTAFQELSYADRYRLAFERARGEGDLDAVCLVLSDKTTQNVTYPDSTMTFNAFAAQLHARAIAVNGMLS